MQRRLFFFSISLHFSSFVNFSCVHFKVSRLRRRRFFLCLGFFFRCIDSLISMVLLLLILMIVYLLLLFCFWMGPSATGQLSGKPSIIDGRKGTDEQNIEQKNENHKCVSCCRVWVNTQHIVVRCICILVVSTRIQSTMLYWYYLIWWFCCFSLSLYALSFICLLVLACDLVVCVLHYCCCRCIVWIYVNFGVLPLHTLLKRFFVFDDSFFSSLWFIRFCFFFFWFFFSFFLSSVFHLLLSGYTQCTVLVWCRAYIVIDTHIGVLVYCRAFDRRKKIK